MYRQHGKPMTSAITAGQPAQTEAWIIFNQHLKSQLPKLVNDGFERVFLPKKPGFKEHDLNDQTAKLVQEVGLLCI